MFELGFRGRNRAVEDHIVGIDNYIFDVFGKVKIINQSPHYDMCIQEVFRQKMSPSKSSEMSISSKFSGTVNNPFAIPIRLDVFSGLTRVIFIKGLPFLAIIT